jgi:hypothetical protein
MKVTVITIDKRPVQKQQTETQQLTTLLEELFEEVERQNKIEEQEIRKKSRFCIVS